MRLPERLRPYTGVQDLLMRVIGLDRCWNSVRALSQGFVVSRDAFLTANSERLDELATEFVQRYPHHFGPETGCRFNLWIPVERARLEYAMSKVIQLQQYYARDNRRDSYGIGHRWNRAATGDTSESDSDEASSSHVSKGSKHVDHARLPLTPARIPAIATAPTATSISAPAAAPTGPPASACGPNDASQKFLPLDTSKRLSKRQRTDSMIRPSTSPYITGLTR
jgi:hypothetical protein